jgi:hypothetical protein
MIEIWNAAGILVTQNVGLKDRRSKADVTDPATLTAVAIEDGMQPAD